MTEDLLERRLSAAMEGRAAGARPGGPRFDDVERRATRRRRRRASRLAGVTALSVVVLLVGVFAVSGMRADVPSGVTMTPASEPVVSAPAVIVGDRWAVLGGIEPIRSEVAVETAEGVQPNSGGMQDIEVTPYLRVAQRGEDEDILYGLDGATWTTTTTWSEPVGPRSSGPGSSVATSVVRGSSFDPSRFTYVPNSINSLRPAASGTPNPDSGTPNPYENARPEQLLAAPESSPVENPVVEHLGSFDWVVLPETCMSGFDSCHVVAVGGDAEQVIVVDLTVPNGFDVRAALTGVELRSGGELVHEPGWDPPSSDPMTQATNAAPLPGWAAAPFLIVRLAIVHDDSVWPAEVPSDHCTAYKAWKQIQIDDLGSFGTPGWIRWAEALDAMAPPEVGDAYRTLADEASAGHDVSATQPGIDALSTVVTYGDGHCP